MSAVGQKIDDGPGPFVLGDQAAEEASRGERCAPGPLGHAPSRSRGPGRDVSSGGLLGQSLVDTRAGRVRTQKCSETAGGTAGSGHSLVPACVRAAPCSSSLVPEGPRMPDVPGWVPLAAIVTIILGVVFAPLLARRQENGKLQAAAEAELRALVVGLRSDVMHARQELDRNSTYVADAFIGQALVDFTAQVVGLARKLPARRQRKVGAALAVLVGRWRIRLAEDIGPTWLSSRAALAEGRDVALTPAAGLMDTAKLEAVMNSHRLRAIDEDDGLLGKMRTAQLPDEEHPAMLAAVDRLLDVSGGAHRLGQSRARKILRRRALSE